MPQPGDTVFFEPDNIVVWHSFHWDFGELGLDMTVLQMINFPIPIPRIEVISAEYNSLLALLKDLTTPYFEQIVTHWPAYPIPVRMGEAANGPVNLSECLTEAMAIWNDTRTPPWFIAESDENWGIRLIHFPDRTMAPSMAAKITRLDSLGNPMRVQIVTGNNYDHIQERLYAVRGFVHELGHALFLWGHSEEMSHCLWRRGPPLVEEPSIDERKAAQWWHGLPEGLDLSNYLLQSINP